MYILASKTDRAPQDLQTPFTVHNQKSTINHVNNPDYNNNNNNKRICIAQVCRMTSEALDGQLQ